METRGRTWCRTDPTVLVDHKPVHISLTIPRELADMVTGVSITVLLSKGSEVKIPPGQENKHVFGHGATVTSRVVGDDESSGVVVLVESSEPGQLIVEVSSQHHSFDGLFGSGELNSTLVVDSELIPD